VHARSDQNERLKAFKKPAAFLARTLLSPWPAVDASTGRQHQAPARQWRPMRRESRFVCASSGQAVNRVSGRIKQGQSPRTIRIEGQ
jgi:hypothetical protein